MSNSFAVVVGIQDYQQRDIKGVKYSHNDARGFAAVLSDHLSIPDQNIKVWLDQEATFARFHSELKSDILNLSHDDRFFFFYAGHGFWAPKGGNRLTAWDTHLNNASGTSVSIEEVLFAPLRQSRCKQSAIFIDACSEEIFEDPNSRNMLAQMAPKEFVNFVRDSRFAAAFFACSPEEKSKSSPALKHGIWTYHLLRALRGEEPGAITNERFVTGESLQTYLYDAVRKYIREHASKGSARQSPFASIAQNTTFILTEVSEPDRESATALFKLDYENAFFFGEDTRAFRSFPSFSPSKKHTVPTTNNSSATIWAQRLLDDDLKDELQAVSVQAHKVLKIRSSKIVKKVHLGSGTIDTDLFRYELDAFQNPEDPSETMLRREVHLRTADLPADFDEVFFEKIDGLQVPIPGTRGRFIDLLDAVEDCEEQLDLESEGDQATKTISVTLQDGTRYFIDTENEVLKVLLPRANGCLGIVEELKKSGIIDLSGAPKTLSASS